MLVESSLSPSQTCARSRRSTSQQRWVACKILNSSLISESCSNCYVWWLPRHKIKICLFSFLSGMLWEWNPLLKHQALGTCRDKDDIHWKILPSPQWALYLFIWAFQCLCKYCATVFIWVHLRISKHCENFNDLADTVPALLKINSNRPFDISSNHATGFIICWGGRYISHVFAVKKINIFSLGATGMEKLLGDWLCCYQSKQNCISW